MAIQLKNIDLLGDAAFILVIKFALLEFCTVGGTEDGWKKMLRADVRRHIS